MDKAEEQQNAASPLPDYSYTKWPGEQSLINPNENELDASIASLGKRYEVSDAPEQTAIRGSLSKANIYTLLAFAKRSVLFAMRKNEPAYLRNAFTAVAMIETDKCDYRDILVTFSFLNHGAIRLNMDATQLFEKTSGMATTETAGLLTGFSKEAAAGKSLGVMGGYSEIETPYGAAFVTTRYNKYQPEYNLASILFKISDIVYTDKYSRGQLSIGDKLEPIWLSATDNPNIRAILSRADGCASLTSYLKEEFEPADHLQSLLIYLAAFKEQKDVETLVNHANGTIPKSFSRLCIGEGNLLFIAIQRAVRDGIPDAETNESLQRFGESILATLTI